MAFAFVAMENYDMLHLICVVAIQIQPMMCHSLRQQFQFLFFPSVYANGFDNRVKVASLNTAINQDPLIWLAILVKIKNKHSMIQNVKLINLYDCFIYLFINK